MSGGSYNYLCHAVDRGDLPGADSYIVETVDRMEARLRELAAERDPDGDIGYQYAATRTTYVRAGLRSAASWATFLAAVWRAVEWLDSSDYGPEQVDEIVREWFHSDGPSAVGSDLAPQGDGTGAG